MDQNDLNSARRSAKEAPTVMAQKKKPYKVVLESITQEKKKLRSRVSYEVQAPGGYTFVPVGAPDLTEQCKELSRKRGLFVYVVSAQPPNKAHKNPRNISHHIHRIGHHFVNEVVEQACQWQGLRSRGGRYVHGNAHGRLGTSTIAKRLDNHGKRLGLSEKDYGSQKQQEAVSEAIRDLFPKIPTEDQKAIVARAFEEGTARVGNAPDMPLPRRVQLAVVAHIRHTRTDYDNLLKTTGWDNARRAVEAECLEQIVKWRGEDDTGEGELEDIFEEVIVLDDDSDRASTGSAEDADRGSSVEIVSSQRHAAELDDDIHLSNTWTLPGEPRTISTPSIPPRIVHVQPKRLFRPAQLLDHDEYRRRYSEARARLREPRGHSFDDEQRSKLILSPQNSAINSNTGFKGLPPVSRSFDEWGAPRRTSLDYQRALPISIPDQFISSPLSPSRSGQGVPRPHHATPLGVPAVPDPSARVTKTYIVGTGPIQNPPARSVEELYRPVDDVQAWAEGNRGMKRRASPQSPPNSNNSNPQFEARLAGKRPRVQTSESTLSFREQLSLPFHSQDQSNPDGRNMVGPTFPRPNEVIDLTLSPTRESAAGSDYLLLNRSKSGPAQHNRDVGYFNLTHTTEIPRQPNRLQARQQYFGNTHQSLVVREQQPSLDTYGPPHKREHFIVVDEPKGREPHPPQPARSADPHLVYVGAEPSLQERRMQYGFEAGTRWRTMKPGAPHPSLPPAPPPELDEAYLRRRQELGGDPRARGMFATRAPSVREVRTVDDGVRRMRIDDPSGASGRRGQGWH